MENTPNRKNLKLLWWLRNIAIIGQAVAVVVTTTWLQIPLNTTPLWFIIALLVLLNTFTCLRLRHDSEVRERELFCHLLADVMALYGLLYYSGGATNPFASLFIMQVVIAAIALRPFYTWVIACFTIGLYTALMFWNVEVPYFHHHHIGDFFNIHVQGMWVSFVLLALLVAGFIARIGSIMRKQEQLLAEAEQIAALGTLAAGAAHELGTPLATIAVLAGEYKDEAATDEQKTRAKTLWQQIKRCKDILSNITAGAGVMRAVQGEAQPLDGFLESIAADFRRLRPQTILEATFGGTQPAPRILAEQSLRQAIANLLNNAADASPDSIRMKGQWTEAMLTLTITDHGRGIPDTVAQAIGQVGNTTKPEGLGLGLYLAKSIIHRLGGSMTLQNGKQGAVANITLPLSRLKL